jgi:hypothetical protein
LWWPAGIMGVAPARAERPRRPRQASMLRTSGGSRFRLALLGPALAALALPVLGAAGLSGRI